MSSELTSPAARRRDKMTTQVVAPAGRSDYAVVQREVRLAAPTADQVLVRVHAIGVNPSDWKSLLAEVPRREPVVVGFEAAGVITSIGSNVARSATARVGDEVIVYPVLGAYASEIVAPIDALVRKPSSLDFAQAANLLLVGATAAEMIDVNRPRATETVLVHGASGATGISLLQQLARQDLRIIATSSTSNFDLVRSFKAEPVTYGPGLADRVRTMAPAGIDAAYDCVGTEEAMQVSLDLVGDPHRIVTIANGDRAGELGIRFIDGRDPRSYAYRNQQRARLVDMAENGGLTVHVSRTLPLSAAQEALETLRSEHPGGKLALIPGR